MTNIQLYARLLRNQLTFVIQLSKDFDVIKKYLSIFKWKTESSEEIESWQSDRGQSGKSIR